MSNNLTATATLINDKVKFSGVSRDNPQVIIDYVQPVGEGEGYTSLELFLISLATCSGTSVSSILRKMGKHISDLEVTANGERREEHPTYFKKIHLNFMLRSENTSNEEMEKALNVSKDSICPVWNMVKNNVDITFSWEIL